MPSVIIYPRTYTRVVDSGSGLVRSPGDAEVNELFDELMQRMHNYQSWELRRKGMLVAMRMFNEFFRWAMEQQNNSSIVGFNYDFLLDTLGFINTGKRRMSTVNWLSLVSEDASPSHGQKAIRAVPLPLGMFNNKTEETIVKWCSQEGGLEDMIMTMYVLFGRSTENP